MLTLEYHEVSKIGISTYLLPSSWTARLMLNSEVGFTFFCGDVEPEIDQRFVAEDRVILGATQHDLVSVTVHEVRRFDVQIGDAVERCVMIRLSVKDKDGFEYRIDAYTKGAADFGLSEGDVLIQAA